MKEPRFCLVQYAYHNPKGPLATAEFVARKYGGQWECVGASVSEEHLDEHGLPFFYGWVVKRVR